MKKKVLLKEIKNSMPCWGCDGTGKKKMLSGKGKIKWILTSMSTCPLCHGTGRYVEKHFIIGDGKIAFDCDSLK